jgi:hypothetical protein
MTPKLTEEQRAALEQHAGQPIVVIDPVKQAEYVLLPVELYQRVQALLGNDQSIIHETYSAQEQAFGDAGWNDSALDVYNDYDAHRRPQ